jgi:hypothetical protein
MTHNTPVVQSPSAVRHPIGVNHPKFRATCFRVQRLLPPFSRELRKNRTVIEVFFDFDGYPYAGRSAGYYFRYR